MTRPVAVLSSAKAENKLAGSSSHHQSFFTKTELPSFPKCGVAGGKLSESDACLRIQRESPAEAPVGSDGINGFGYPIQWKFHLAKTGPKPGQNRANTEPKTAHFSFALSQESRLWVTKPKLKWPKLHFKVMLSARLWIVQSVLFIVADNLQAKCNSGRPFKPMPKLHLA